MARGFRCVTVLDVARAALERARGRLGQGAPVEWVHADVTGAWTSRPAAIWHDRAVFHFLTAADDRAAYRTRLHEMLIPGGHAIIATFAPEGPERCSGLPVRRYAAEELAREMGPAFTLLESVPELHRTPSGGTQAFLYCRFRRDG